MPSCAMNAIGSMSCVAPACVIASMRTTWPERTRATGALSAGKSPQVRFWGVEGTVTSTCGVCALSAEGTSRVITVRSDWAVLALFIDPRCDRLDQSAARGCALHSLDDARHHDGGRHRRRGRVTRRPRVHAVARAHDLREDD